MTAAEKIKRNISGMDAAKLADAVILRQITFEDIRNAFGAESNSKLTEVQNCLNSKMENRWRTVRLWNTKEDYQDYLDVFPANPHRAELAMLMRKASRRAADETAWCNLDLDDIDSLKNFLKTYPISGHATEAAALLKQLEDSLPEDVKCWMGIDKKNYAKIVEFIGKYPDSSKLEEAQSEKKRIEDAWDESERAWRTLDKNDRDSLIKYQHKYRNSTHYTEAGDILDTLDSQDIDYDDNYILERIDEIKKDQRERNMPGRVVRELENLVREGKYSFDYLCEFICRNPNALDPDMIKGLERKRLITYDNLQRLGINKRFTDALKNIDQQRTVYGVPPTIMKISNISTEIYFWGLPSDGKSCAIGAILSVAGNGKIAKVKRGLDCQGRDYVDKLEASFKGSEGIVLLPPGTKVTETYEMAFKLKDEKGKFHPITIIDLAGELVRCFHLKKEEFNEDEKLAWETLERLLISGRSKNRKIHFFVIEYGKKDYIYKGVQYSTYFDAVTKYIGNEHNFLKHDTDAIYIMVTKVDKTGKKGHELEEEIRRFLDKEFLGFCNSLSDYCKSYNINGGKLVCIPFSLGEVCFSDLCIFDDKPASNIVKTLLARSAGFSESTIRKMIQK